MTKFALPVILVLYVLVGVLFAVKTPAWQAPDEPAHYNYVAQVAANGCCPVIQTGDWDSAYLEQLKATRFAPELLGDFSSIQYEDHQPPLYYLLQALVYRLTNGSLTALRLVSVLLGAGVVYCAYAVSRVILPERPTVALGAAAFVAFLPQHVAMLASVNNDALAELVVGVTLVVVMKMIPPPNRQEHQEERQEKHEEHKDTKDTKRENKKQTDLGVLAVQFFSYPVLLGMLAGIGLLTKLSTLALLPIVVYALLRCDWGAWKVAARKITVFALIALVIGALWWLRDISVYGFPDVFGLRAHDSVVVGQARTADFISTNGWGAYLQMAGQTTFNSFWGQFGWMGVPLWGWLYSLFAVVTLAGVVGLVAVGVGTFVGTPNGVSATAPDGRAVARPDKRWDVLLLAAGLAVLQYAYYNTSFLQLQGRYMFVGLIPFAIGLAVGLDYWARRLPMRWVGWAVPALLMFLAPLDVYLIWRVIEPMLRP